MRKRPGPRWIDGWVLVPLLLLPAPPMHGAPDGAETRPSAADEIRRLLPQAQDLVRQGQSSAAAELLQAAYERAHELRGDDLILAGTVVEVLADALHRSGSDVPLEDRPKLLELVAAQEKILGPDHPSVAQVLMELACLSYSWRGTLETAELYDRISHIHQEGGAVLDAARARTYLGILLNESGDWSRAVDAFDQARRLIEEKTGTYGVALATAEPGRSDVALLGETLGHLGVARLQLGDLTTAEDLLSRGLELQRRVHGPDHRTVGTTLQSLGTLRHLLGQSDAGRRDLEHATEIWRRRGGDDHFLVGLALSQLGRLELDVGRLDIARRHLERAADVLDRRLSMGAHRQAAVQRYLGRLEMRAGRLDVARQRFFKALELQRVGPFQQHPETALNLDDLARLTYALGDVEQAFELSLEAEAVGRQVTAQNFELLAERSAHRLQELQPRGLDTALTLLSRGIGDPDAAWTEVLRSRALVLDTMLARRRALEDGDVELRRRQAELAEARRRLSRLVVEGPIGPMMHQRISQATQKRDEAERRVAVATGNVPNAEPLELQDLVDRLPTGTALLAFSRFQPVDPRRPEQREGDGAYMAWIHRAGAAGSVAVPLGDAAGIDAAIDELHRRIRGHSTARFARAARDLRSLLWDPVAAVLHGPSQDSAMKPSTALSTVRQLWIVPDGELFRVPWSALVFDDGRYWAEAGPVVHHVVSERDLIEAPPPSRGLSPAGPLLAVGGVDFDARDALGDRLLAALPAPQPPFALPPSRLDTRPSADLHSADLRSTDLRSADLPCSSLPTGEGFLPLAASASEAETVAALHEEILGGESAVLTGAAASEAAFRSLAPHSRRLHMATHSFAHRPCGPDATAPDSYLGAGLIMAGANRRRDASPVEDDGILTAEEIVALDLSKVELVVLSSCDSGVGRAVPGEGILGLRRAFRLTGAQSLITSLWPVDDSVAARWMESLYLARWREGLSIPQAVRRAELATLELLRQEGRDTHPYYWAPFVSEGPPDAISRANAASRS